MCYAKSVDDCVCNGLPRSSEADSRYSNPDNDPRGVWTSADLSVGPVVQSKVYEITTPSGRKVIPSNGRCWLFEKGVFDELVADNRIWFGEDGNNVPRVKKFLKDVKQGITPMTLWKYTEVGHSQDAAKNLKNLFDGKAFFDYPKSVELIKRCCQLYSDPNSIILDFFSGSATTAHAVMKLNAQDGGSRKYIMVQLPEVCDENSEAAKAGFNNICEIGQERIRRAGNKIKEELEVENAKASVNNTPECQAQMRFDGGVLEDGQASKKQLPDIGFRVFKLDESGIVRPDPMQLLEDVVKPDRTPEDIVVEMMLKWGMELTHPIKKINVANYTAYSVSEGELICCMNEGLTKAALTEIGKLAPRRVLMLDKILNDNLKLNAIQIFKHASEVSGIEIELRTV